MSNLKSKPRGAQRIAHWWSVALSIGILASGVPPRALADEGNAPLTVPSLQGTWQLSFMGYTGCGFTTMVETAVLDAAGVGKVTTTQSHTTGCGWNLIVQVAANAQMLTAIDVDPVNPGNFIQIVAVRRNTGDPHKD